MPRLRRRVQQVPQLRRVARPTQPVEELHGLELKLVPRLVRHARAQVHVPEPFPRKPFHRARHQDHPKVSAASREVVKSVVVVRQTRLNEVEQHRPHLPRLAARSVLLEVQDMGDDPAGQQPRQPLRRKHARPEALRSKAQPRIASDGSYLELRHGQETGTNAAGLAQDPSVLRRRPPFGQRQTQVPHEVKPVERGRCRQESRLKRVRHRLARLQEPPDDVGIQVSRVVRRGLGEQELHVIQRGQICIFDILLTRARLNASFSGSFGSWFQKRRIPCAAAA